MRVKSKKVNFMVPENITLKMVIPMRDSLNKISSMEKENTYRMMENNISKGSSKTIKKMVSVFIITPMVLYMKDNGKMI